jgi:hypothetical protein
VGGLKNTFSTYLIFFKSHCICFHYWYFHVELFTKVLCVKLHFCRSSVISEWSFDLWRIVKHLQNTFHSIIKHKQYWLIMVYMLTCRVNCFCLCWKPVKLHDAFYWIAWIKTYFLLGNCLLETRAVAWYWCPILHMIIWNCGTLLLQSVIYLNTVGYFVWRAFIKYCF